MAALTGGDKLTQRLREISGRIARPVELRVGFLEGATYPDGTPVPKVAFWNEFGTSRSPPRPFFRGMIRENSGAWPGEIATLLSRTDYDPERTLGLMGERIVGQLRQSIRDLQSPPLAPSTVRAKGFAKPLIDTGHMLNSADYEVSAT